MSKGFAYLFNLQFNATEASASMNPNADVTRNLLSLLRKKAHRMYSSFHRISRKNGIDSPHTQHTP